MTRRNAEPGPHTRKSKLSQVCEVAAKTSAHDTEGVVSNATYKEKEINNVAKYRHRVFEMYDFRDEALCALKPKAASPATDEIDSEPWDFTLLAASRRASVTHVSFKEAQDLSDDVASDLRKDFAQLTDKLTSDSKLLLDFTGLSAISTDSIDTLVTFNKNLRHKGSRMVLCCLDSAVRDSFFPAR